MKKMNQNQRRMKKNDANDHREIVLWQAEGCDLSLNFIHWVAGCEKMMNARCLEQLPCGHWTPENVVCRCQPPLCIHQTPQKVPYGGWTPTKIPPRTLNLFPPIIYISYVHAIKKGDVIVQMLLVIIALVYPSFYGQLFVKRMLL